MEDYIKQLGNSLKRYNGKKQQIKDNQARYDRLSMLFMTCITAPMPPAILQKYALLLAPSLVMTVRKL